MPSNPGISDLYSILNEVKRLKVPNFQRNFAWEEKNIEDFHRGLIRAITDNSKIFLGTTILMEDEDNKNRSHFWIIDGQQRFTTIFMYLSILRDEIYALETRQYVQGPQIRNPLTVISNLMWTGEDQNSYVLKFQANQIIKSIFDEQIQKDPPLNPATNTSLERQKLPELTIFNSELINAYVQIKKRIKQDLETLNETEKIQFIDKLAKALAHQLQILCIYTKSIPESFDIFLTLNSTGLPLGPSDLVKTIFMRHLSVTDSSGTDELMNDDVASKWRDLMDNLNDPEGPEQFLRHYLISKITNTTVTAKQIFTIIQEDITSYYDSNENIQKKRNKEDCKTREDQLLNDLIRVSQIYGTLLKPQEIETSNPNSLIRRHCFNLKSLSDSYRIALIHILDTNNELTDLERIELTRLCEILTLRWSIVNGGRQEIENIFCGIAKKFVQKDSYDNIRKELIDTLPLDEEVKSQFHIGIKKSNVVRVVLNKINSVVNNVYLLNQDPSVMHVEHIAPQKATPEWLEYLLGDFPENDRKSDYAKYSEYWGNKTILEKPINTSIKQSLFRIKCEGSLKKPGYKDSVIEITKNLIEFEEWTTKIIQRRNDWIRDCFIKIWNIENKSSEVLSYEKWISNQ
jgi:uncharacterized protein with ParB-like and HNH nuclease domain